MYLEGIVGINREQILNLFSMYDQFRQRKKLSMYFQCIPHFLPEHISQSPQCISLSQLSYIDSILMRFNLADSKPFTTPMDSSIRFSKDQCPQTLEEAAKMSKVPYREAIGSLNYCAVATWPDIAFSVSLLAQFMDNLGKIHWEAVKRVFRYLKGTRNWVLTYGTTNDGLNGYTDADGSSQEHRHAISGYVFLVNGGAVSWSSKKQELVTLSTVESEYVAATYAAKEALWLRRIVGEIFEPITEPTTLYSDSQSASRLPRMDRITREQSILISGTISFDTLYKTELLTWYTVLQKKWLPTYSWKLFQIARPSISRHRLDYVQLKGEHWGMKI